MSPSIYLASASARCFAIAAELTGLYLRTVPIAMVLPSSRRVNLPRAGSTSHFSTEIAFLKLMRMRALAKERMNLGFSFVTISSDYKSFS